MDKTLPAVIIRNSVSLSAWVCEVENSLLSQQAELNLNLTPAN